MGECQWDGKFSAQTQSGRLMDHEPGLALFLLIFSSCLAWSKMQRKLRAEGCAAAATYCAGMLPLTLALGCSRFQITDNH
jgi:hypothetical protein